MTTRSVHPTPSHCYTPILWGYRWHPERRSVGSGGLWIHQWHSPPPATPPCTCKYLRVKMSSWRLKFHKSVFITVLLAMNTLFYSLNLILKYSGTIFYFCSALELVLLPGYTVLFKRFYIIITVVPVLGDPRLQRPPAVYGLFVNLPTYFNVKLPVISGHLPNEDADSHLLVVSTCYNGKGKQMPRIRWSFQPKIACAFPNLRPSVLSNFRAVVW